MLRSMNETAVRCASLFPTFATYLVSHEKIPAFVSLEYANAYNRWLKQYCDYDPVRLIGVGFVSRHDPTNMLDQLATIVSYGWKSIIVRPEIIAGRVLGHRDYDRFWSECERNNIGVVIHCGSHAFLPTAGTDRFDSHFSLNACSHSMEIQMAFLSLLESGTLERHPKLKFAFLEAGASWLPHWLWRLDNICYPEFRSITKENIKMLPSEYFKRQCWVAMEFGEPCLRQVIDMIGHEKLLYGTDFPHPDHSQFAVGDLDGQFRELSASELNDILVKNSLEFYGVNIDVQGFTNEVPSLALPS